MAVIPDIRSSLPYMNTMSSPNLTGYTPPTIDPNLNNRSSDNPQDKIGGKYGGAATNMTPYINTGLTAFNSVFGAITRYKQGQLQATQIRQNADLQKSVADSNIASAKQDLASYTQSAMSQLNATTRQIKEFAGGQKAVAAGNGMNLGATQSAYLLDTYQKGLSAIAAQSSTAIEAIDSMNYQIALYSIESDFNYKMSGIQANFAETTGTFAAISSVISGAASVATLGLGGTGV